MLRQDGRCHDDPGLLHPTTRTLAVVVVNVWWKTLAALLVILPVGGYAFGVMTAAPDQPAQQEPIRITQVSDDPTKSPSSEPTRKPTKEPTRKPGSTESGTSQPNGHSGGDDDDDDDEIEDVPPDIDDLDDDDDDDDRDDDDDDDDDRDDD